MAFSLLGELEDEDDEEDEKLTPLRPGGFVAVFCPVRLLRQTGQLSCFAGRSPKAREVRLEDSETGGRAR